MLIDACPASTYDPSRRRACGLARAARRHFTSGGGMPSGDVVVHHVRDFARFSRNGRADARVPPRSSGGRLEDRPRAVFVALEAGVEAAIVRRRGLAFDPALDAHAEALPPRVPRVVEPRLGAGDAEPELLEAREA